VALRCDSELGEIDCCALKVIKGPDRNRFAPMAPVVQTIFDLSQVLMNLDDSCSKDWVYTKASCRHRAVKQGRQVACNLRHRVGRCFEAWCLKIVRRGY